MEYPIQNAIDYHRIFLGIPQNILLNFIEYAIEYSIEYSILMEYPIGNSTESHGISYSKCNRISHRIFLGIPRIFY